MIFVNKIKKLSKIISLIIILCLFSNGNLIKISKTSFKKSSLSEKFKNYFFVGAAINKNQISRECNEVDVYPTKTEYILF